MTFETFIKIILVINILMICCIPFHARRFKKLLLEKDALEKLLAEQPDCVETSSSLLTELAYARRDALAREKDADYWEDEYHKLFARYEHGQTTIRRLGQENKALKTQAPTPKRRGRPSKEA